MGENNSIISIQYGPENQHTVQFQLDADNELRRRYLNGGLNTEPDGPWLLVNMDGSKYAEMIRTVLTAYDAPAEYYAVGISLTE